MAQTRGVKPDEELNFILKSLANRGKDSEIFKKYNEYLIGDFLLPRHLHSESNNGKIDHDHIMLRTYGSSAEDLQFCDPCDILLASYFAHDTPPTSEPARRLLPDKLRKSVSIPF